MSDDTARAVGAAEGGDPVIIAGKECRARPLSLRELGELERDCLSQYRKAQIVALKETLEVAGDEIPRDVRQQMIQDKVVEVAGLDLKSLPSRFVYEAKKIELTNELKRWLENNAAGYLTNPDNPRYDESLRHAASNVLEEGILSDEDYERMAKKPPRKTKTSYIGWWTSGSVEGRLSVIAAAFRDQGVTRDQVSEALVNKPGVMAQVQRDIERLTAPDTKNG